MVRLLPFPLFTEPNNDKRRFMDTLHMALTIYEVWHYLIDSIGDYPALLEMTWCASFLPVYEDFRHNAYRSYKASIFTTKIQVPDSSLALCVSCKF